MGGEGREEGEGRGSQGHSQRPQTAGRSGGRSGKVWPVGLITLVLTLSIPCMVQCMLTLRAGLPLSSTLSVHSPLLMTGATACSSRTTLASLIFGCTSKVNRWCSKRLIEHISCIVTAHAA